MSRLNTAMKGTPPTWLNSEFLEKALRSNGKDPNITVTSCEINRAAMVGDHYGSEMYRATLKIKNKEDSEDLSVIIKCKLLFGDVTELSEDVDTFIKEANTFKILHVPMSNILKDAINNYQPFAAKCLYLHTEPPTQAIVLEDLKKYGFRLTNVSLGMDLDHCLLVMRKIAQYHAASVVIHEKHPDSFKSFMCNFFSTEADKEYGDIVRRIVKNCTEIVSKWAGYEEYVDILKSLEVTMIPKMMKDIQRDDKGFNVLNHGDLWLNNIMFRYNEPSDLQDARFVDFQLSYYASPVVDLLYFLNSSASPDVLENSEVLIDEYHIALCDTLSKLGYHNVLPTKEMLKSEWNKRCIFGIYAALSTRAFALKDPNHIPDVENLLNKGQFYLSDAFQQFLKKVLPLYKKWGWLKI